MLSIRRFVIALLIVTALTLVSIEAMLRVIDPVGLIYYEDLTTFFDAAILNDSGYQMPAGQRAFSTWSYTINADGSRAVPNAGSGERVVFVGDSITFSWGVDDAESWVNLVAHELGINAINAGRPGYNAAQVLDVVSRYPDAERIVYLSFNNDNQPATKTETLHFYSRTHMLIEVLQQLPSMRRDPAFAVSMQALADDPRVLMLAFAGDEYGDVARDNYGAILIPPYTHRISAADMHADDVGNRQIAAGVVDVLATWVAR